MFYVGQKVVCIDNSTWAFWCERPLVGPIYTISASWRHSSGEELVDLVELPCRDHFLVAFGFVGARFRPIVERKTDISIFKKMLTPVKQQEPV
jgi:hypothetical protein